MPTHGISFRWIPRNEVVDSRRSRYGIRCGRRCRKFVYSLQFVSKIIIECHHAQVNVRRLSW